MLWHVASVVCWLSQCSVAVSTEGYTTNDKCVQHVEAFVDPLEDRYKDKFKSASYLSIRCVKNREGAARPSAKYVLRLIGPRHRLKV